VRTNRRSRLPRPDAFTPRARTRQPLTRDDLVRAGLEVLDEAGIDGLTMRTLAERLSIQSASLYWHVRDKDELLALIADAICAEIEPPNADQPWIAQLEAMAWEFRRVLLAHRDAALVLANTPPVGPNRLRLAERMLTVLVRAGIEPGVVARAGMLLTDYVINAVIEEGRAREMTDALATDADGASAGGIQGWFARLPVEEYPTLVALAADLTDIDSEARFRFGLELLLKGLLAKMRESPA
jgi:AcrR family transcriptional regulator